MAMCAAFGDEPGKNMQILIGQLVNVMKDGKPVRMSKRAGNVVTIDACLRWSAWTPPATRWPAPITTRTSTSTWPCSPRTPTTTRCTTCSTRTPAPRTWTATQPLPASATRVPTWPCSTPRPTAKCSPPSPNSPSVLATAADDRQPHKVARYLEELAATYHKWYNVERVVPMALTDPETRGDDEARKALEIAKNPEPARAAARLKLNDAVQQVIANGLDLLGVTAPEKM